ncbi:MAG: TonB-dependent receptor [Bacteroidota bacterium]
MVPLGLFGQGGNVLIREYYSNKTLEMVLTDIRINYQIEFTYDKEDLKGLEIREINIKGLDLPTTMAALLKGSDLDFELTGPKSVRIIKKANKKVVSYEATRKNISVSGRVFDVNSGETLPYTTISVPGTSRGSISNLDGHFTLIDVPSDTTTIVVHFLGYETKYIKLNPELASGEIDIYIRPVDYRIEEVMVVGEEKKLVKVAEKTSQISLRPAQIEMIPNLGEKDIFRALQLMPGVSSGNETSSGLYVRGGTPDQNLILFDGFTVYHVDHFYGFLSAFNADAVKDVQLYKGGFESKYGGKISSVMELTGKTGNTKSVSGGFGLSALSGSAYIEIPVNQKLQLFFAGRRSYTDFIQSGLYESINDMYNSTVEEEDFGPGASFGRFQSDPVFYFYDINSKVTWKPNNKDLLTFSFYNGKDVLDNTNDMSAMMGPPPGMTTSDNNFSMKTVDVMDWGNWGLSGKWSRQWNDRLYSNTTMAWSNYFSNRDNYRERDYENDDGETETSVTGSVEDNNILDYTLRMDNEYRLTQNNTLEFGTQVTYSDVSYNYTMNDTLDMIGQRTRGLTTALYLQNRLFLIDKITLVYGMRSTWYNLTNKVYWEPRFSVNYQATDRIRIKASWGNYYQFTNKVTRENILEGNREFWLLADDETTPVSQAYHYIAGASYETSNYLFDFEAFYKPMTGLSEFSLRETGIRQSVQMPEVFYTGTGVSKGFEVLMQKKFGKYTGWLSYTFTRVIHNFPDLSDEPFSAIHDQPHEINLVQTYQWRNWVLGATFVYNTGQTYTAPIGAYTLTMVDGTEIDYIHVGEKNGYRLPAYHRLDLSATYRFNIGKSKGSVGLSVFNVYGRKNIWYRQFDIEDNSIVIMDVNTLGFTPNVFVAYQF